MAEGLTNKEVATRLRLSVRTAENHVLNVMNKLGLDNRAQVAAWFTRTSPPADPQRDGRHQWTGGDMSPGSSGEPG